MTDPSASSRTSSLVERMVGAAFLSVDTFEEVEHDQNATGQPVFVAAIVAVARGDRDVGQRVGCGFSSGGGCPRHLGCLGWHVLLHRSPLLRRKSNLGRAPQDARFRTGSGSLMDIRIRSDPGLAAVRVAPSLGRSRGVYRGSSGARYRQYQDHADDLGGSRCERFPRAPLLT